MYFGNVSNFFYKNKAWIHKQPRFSIGANKKTNIMKIGKKYFSLDTVTGKLKLIIPKFNSPKKISSGVKQNNNTFDENKKDNFPEVFNSINKDINNHLINTDKNIRNNTNIKNKISFNHSLLYDEKNKNESINNYSAFDKIETKLSKNKKFKNLIFRNNTDNSLDNKNKIENTSFKIKTIQKLKTSNISKFESEIIKYKLKIQKYKKLENNRNIDNKLLLSKKNIKKIFKTKQNKTMEMNSNILTTNYSKIKKNNKSNIYSFSLNKKDNKNHKTNIKTLNKQANKIILNINENNFEKRLFPNDFSLRIKKGDSSYLKTIKDQILKDRIINDLENQYQFYEDSKNKREFLKVPKINLENTVELIKNEIFPPKESLYHKLYFHYVNKQRQKDNLIYGLDYPLLHIKKE